MPKVSPNDSLFTEFLVAGQKNVTGESSMTIELTLSVGLPEDGRRETWTAAGRPW